MRWWAHEKFTFFKYYYYNLRQNEAQSARAESTDKEVNQRSKDVTQTHSFWGCTPGGVDVPCIYSPASESYRKRLRSSLLYVCDSFRALINSFVCWFWKLSSFRCVVIRMCGVLVCVCVCVRVCSFFVLFFRAFFLYIFFSSALFLSSHFLLSFLFVYCLVVLIHV